MAANGIQIIKELYYEIIPLSQDSIFNLTDDEKQGKLDLLKSALCFAPGMDNLDFNSYHSLNAAWESGNLYSVRLVLNAIYPFYMHLDRLYNYPIGIDKFNQIRYSARGKRIFSSIFG